MIPRPAGCLEMTVTSLGPETVKVMLVSSPLCEKMQNRAAAQSARIACGVELPQRPDVQVHIVARHGDSRGGRVHYHDVPSSGGRSAGAERNHIVRNIWRRNDERYGV